MYKIILQASNLTQELSRFLKLNGPQEIPDDLSAGSLRHLIGINTSTLDFMEVPKSHSNLKDFGLRPDNKLLLIQVYQYMFSRVEGGF